MSMLREIIENSGATVGVVGLGYIGLPLACIIASRGYKVFGADINPSVVESVNKGKPHIKEKGLEELLKKVKISATTDVESVVRAADIVIVVVSTPLKGNKACMQAVFDVCRKVAENYNKEKLLIVESTLAIETSKKIVNMLKEHSLTVGRDIFYAYVPERAIPSRTIKEIVENDRVIGAFDENSAELAKAFYSKITKGNIYITDPTTAEVVKLVENTFRDVNIALANEIALLCEKLNVDVLKVIELANKHPRVNLHYPGAGVGGYCLPKDPYFLIYKAREYDLELKLIESARKINESMPLHVVEIVENSLKMLKKERAKIAVLGVAYKGNTDDTRNSPAKDIIHALKRKYDVFSHDPRAKSDFQSNFSRNLKEVVKSADCIVIVTDHDEYKKLDLKELKKLVNENCIIVDGRRILNKKEAEKYGFIYFGIGC